MADLRQPFIFTPVAQLDRAIASDAMCRAFESHQACHVGTSYACSDFLCYKKSVTRSTVPPFRKKVPLGKAARLYCTRQPCLR